MDPQRIAMCQTMCERLDIDLKLLLDVFSRPDWEFLLLAGVFLEAIGNWRFDQLITSEEVTQKALNCHKQARKSGQTPKSKDIVTNLRTAAYITNHNGDFLLNFCNLRNLVAHKVDYIGYTLDKNVQGLEELRRAMKNFLGRAGEIRDDLEQCVLLSAMEQTFGVKSLTIAVRIPDPIIRVCP